MDSEIEDLDNIDMNTLYQNQINDDVILENIIKFIVELIVDYFLKMIREI